MNSIPAIRVTRPIGLLSKTRTQLNPTYSKRISPCSFKHQPGVRSFHVAPPVASTIIQTAENALLALHSLTHTPWFLTIPIAAVGISLAFRLPFNAYTHRINQQRARFTPVLMGWTGRIARDLRREDVPSSREQKELLARHKKVASRIYRTVGLQDWKLYSSFLGLPFWLIGIESVRRICGGPRGLLGHLLLGRAEDDATASNASGNTEIATSSLDITTPATEQVHTADPNVVATAAEHTKNLLDPSIAFEGCLWFPDLSVPDPYHILPLALSSLLVWNMLPKSQAGLRQLAGLNPGDRLLVETPAITRQRRLRRMLIVLSALIGPMTADLPAALHLYWLSTSIAHTVTSKLLSKFMPIDTKVIPRAKGIEAVVIRPKRVEKEVKAAN
ncbi:hypothetical protein F4774DRAFT_68648 [Daldinia eschscholtzii]|nr:hypothetical protein F4774DRAFT_68648 [Daldinia eschscholtzii]